MAKEEMKPILSAVGAEEWLNAGYQGQGVKVWCCEVNSGHGANARQMILDVAPAASVTSMDFGFEIKDGKLAKIPTTGSGVPVADFVTDGGFDIISASNTSSQSDNPEYVAYMKNLSAACDPAILNAAGNDGANPGDTVMTKFPADVCMAVGALTYRNGTFKRASYSARGQELDFMAPVGWWDGTSAATPFLDGLCAILISRYGGMGMEEMYKYLKMISQDMGTVGHDCTYGWGQPILPPLSAKYIRMYVDCDKYKVNGELKTMDTVPVNKNGTVFVPLRAVSEALCRPVDWIKNADNSITITIEGRIKLTTGQIVAYVDGKKHYLPYPPYIDSNNRTMVPIRFVSEGLGCKVDWIQKHRMVMILG